MIAGHLGSRQGKPERTPARQRWGLPNFSMWCPMPLASESSRRLCGSFLNLSERPILKSRPLPTRTNGMSSSVCELPLPSSLVQTIVVLSSRLPPPPGSGVSASRFARYASCSQYHLLILIRLSTDFLLLSGWCDSSWWLSLTPTHFIRACPTELVYWSVATREKS